MSVLIKGMEMPQNCDSCPFFDDSTLLLTCTLTHEFDIYPEKLRKQRLQDCPLVEVPPHGRLIDADSVEKQIDYVANLDWNRKVGASSGMLAALEIVEDALTIIESE